MSIFCHESWRDSFQRPKFKNDTPPIRYNITPNTNITRVSSSHRSIYNMDICTSVAMFVHQSRFLTLTRATRNVRSLRSREKIATHLSQIRKAPSFTFVSIDWLPAPSGFELGPSNPEILGQSHFFLSLPSKRWRGYSRQLQSSTWQRYNRHHYISVL